MSVHILKSICFLFFVFNVCNACDDNNRCNFDENCVNGKCQAPCDAVKCGENSACLNNGMTALCYCQIGYTGNANIGCTKLDKDPCDPNPCGPNSVCLQGEYGRVNEKKFGAYCLCQEKSYGTPPNCRKSCKKNEDCEFNEICEKSQSCVDYCNPSVCGDNSVCRNGNHSVPYCSCLAGYVPQSSVGCRLRTSNDLEIDLEKIQRQLDSVCVECEDCTNSCKNPKEICVNRKCINNPCLDYCEKLSKCNIFNGILECFNDFDSKLNPFKEFIPCPNFESFDECGDQTLSPECAVGISEAAIKALALGK